MTDFDWLQDEILKVIGPNVRGIPPGNILFRLGRHDHYLKVRPSWVKLKSETRDEMVVSATLKLLQHGQIKFVFERLWDDANTFAPIDVVKVRKLNLLDAIVRAVS